MVAAAAAGDGPLLGLLADAALYRAKESGRNRVEVAPMADDVTILAAASRRRQARIERDQAGSAGA